MKIWQHVRQFQLCNLIPETNYQSSLERQFSHYAASTSSSPQTSRLPDGPPLSHFLQPQRDNGTSNIHEKGKGVFIETYGCQQNVSDSEIVYSILASDGYHQSESPTRADIVLLNTCSIREKAEGKIFSRLGSLRSSRAQAHQPETQSQTIGVLGCMAERLKDKLLVKNKLADLVVGPDAYRDLPRLIAAVKGKRYNKMDAINVQLSAEETYADIMPTRPAGTKSAFLSIMRGCNNLCSFCIVPFTRGRERSRPMQSILDEVKALSEIGVKELTLLGQNVNSYADFSEQEQQPSQNGSDAFSIYAKGFRSVYKPKRGGAFNFAELLDKVSSLDPEMRIWFTSPHPKDFNDEVLDVIASHNNIAKMIHMPAQSGSSKMLDLMRRGYTRDAYDDLVLHIRNKLPLVCLSTDMIVGFCGESEEDHAESMDLMRQTGFDQAFLFAYSKRDKTHAARHLQDDVSADIKRRRLNEIIALFRETQSKRKLEEIGSRHLVLVDMLAKDGQSWLGRTANMQRVKILGGEDHLMSNTAISAGKYYDVQISGSSGGSLIGNPISETSVADFAQRHGTVLPSRFSFQEHSVKARAMTASL